MHIQGVFILRVDILKSVYYYIFKPQHYSQITKKKLKVKLRSKCY